MQPLVKSSGWRHFEPKQQKPGPIQAVLWEAIEARRVRCNLCAFRCVIGPGHVGICSVRHNVDGVLYALNYRKATALQVDPVEKKPLNHFYPGARLLSMAAPGCNYHCRFCQNFEISQMPVEYDRIEGEPLEPEWIVERAVQLRCQGIAYTYTEPTVYAEYALEVATIARERGLLNVWVTNGYLTPEAVDLLAPCMDAANVDLKGFDDRFYLKICGARHQHVCDCIRALRERGIWIEVSTVVIPGHNDKDDQMAAIAGFLAGISQDIPWHVAAFFPAYRMRDVPATTPESVRRVRRVGMEAGLKYVYTGNIADEEGSTTYCPRCGEAVIRRTGYAVSTWRLRSGGCAVCGAPISGMGLTAAPAAIDARGHNSDGPDHMYCG